MPYAVFDDADDNASTDAPKYALSSSWSASMYDVQKSGRYRISRSSRSASYAASVLVST